MLKRFLGAVLAAALLVCQVPAASAVGTSASSAILMDADSGRVLYESNAHERRLIASITKLMTALVALESYRDIQEEITVQPQWAGAEGSSIYLRPGEKITLEALLYGMLLRSGNDAALAVAGSCGNSVEDFVVRMNEKAVQLGMTDSHFANPNGLNAEGHYSSAYDMALLARACLENETLAEMVATKSITLGTRVFTNHNKLLWRYEGCVGMKTGFTEKAGRTLVSAAERDGMTLICVTLNDPDDWSDHAALFDYGFANYHTEPLVKAGKALGRLPVTDSLVPSCPVAAGEDAALCLGADETVSRELIFRESSLEAPVVQGQQVGEAVYRLNGQEVLRVPLVTGASVARDRAGALDFFGSLKERIDQLSANENQ